MLADLGVSRFRIMTNNPAKLTGLDGYGLEIVDRVPVEIASNPENEKYLETKRTAWVTRCRRLLTPRSTDFEAHRWVRCVARRSGFFEERRPSTARPLGPGRRR